MHRVARYGENLKLWKRKIIPLNTIDEGQVNCEQKNQDYEKDKFGPDCVRPYPGIDFKARLGRGQTEFQKMAGRFAPGGACERHFPINI